MCCTMCKASALYHLRKVKVDSDEFVVHYTINIDETSVPNQTWVLECCSRTLNVWSKTADVRFEVENDMLP